jgi:DNA-binding transcriptional LysR family regulator
MDVDTRLLRYVAAVAEEGNLTRAAARLFVSQPALTKQIKQLEKQLGFPLFTRSRAGMTLTEPGRVLAERLPALLADWDHLLADTNSTASRAAHVLRVGFVASAANEATQVIVAAFTRMRPDWRVEMRQAAWSNPSAGLVDRDVAIAFVRLPFPGQDDVRVELLLTEPRCVALPASHPLAATEQPLAFRDLLDEPVVAAPRETGVWSAYWVATEERHGHPIRFGAETEHPDDWLSAIANGYGIAFPPESSARFYSRPGIVYRPLSGISPSHVAIAWTPTADKDPAVQDFVHCCLAAFGKQKRTAADTDR